MEPIKLRVKNFAAFRDEDIDLSSIRCAALLGPNGSGKSTLLDALTWALFGEGSKGGKRELDNYVRAGETECAVEVEFILANQTYRVYRSRQTNRNRSTLEFYIKNGEEWVSVGGRTITETQNIIEDTLRLDYKTFTASSLVLQGASDSFTADMTDQERKATLGRILGLDIWDSLLAKVREKLKELRSEKDRLAQEAEAFAKEAELADALGQEQTQLQQTLSRLQDQIEADDKKVAELEAACAKIPVLSASLEALQQDITGRTREITGFTTQRDTLERQLVECDNALKEAEEVKAAVIETEALEKQIKQMDYKGQIFVNFTRRLEDVSNQVHALEKKKSSELAKIAAALSDCQRQATLLTEVPCQGETKDACPLLKNAHKAVAQIPVLEGRQQKLTEQKHPLLVQYEQLQKVRANLSYNSAQHSSLRQKVATYKAKAARLANVKAAEAKKGQLRERLRETKQQIAIATESRDSLKGRYSETQKKLTALIPLQQMLKDEKNQLAFLRTEEGTTRTRLGQIEASIKQAQAAQAKLEASQQTAKAVAKEQETYLVLEQACSKKSGVPALIVENAVPEIERLTNEMLEKLTGDRFRLQLDTRIETKSGTMQDVLRVTVTDGGLERPYITYSGGERFMLDVALRVALSKFLAHRAGAEIRFFALDEGLGSCDAVNREAVMAAMETVAQEFSKTLVVTHIAELQDAFSQRIFVEPGVDGSTVTIAA